MSDGFIVWFTGLSGSGKSTLSAMLAAELRKRGVHVEVLDGDEVRTHLSKGLSFSREDRDINIRRIGFVAKLLARSGACAMSAAISPYKAIRDEQRLHTPRFVEVYCECDISVLAERDIKGLYKKAMAGEIKHFTGIDDPYEPPDNPELKVNTDKESSGESLSKILMRLEELGYIPLHGTSYEIGSKSPGFKKNLVPPHGGELCRRFLQGAPKNALLEKARSLPCIDIDIQAERASEMICTGAFSPLKGFMGSKDYLRVLKDMRLENGLPWPLPMTLAIPKPMAGKLRAGEQVALRAHNDCIVALLDIHDIFAPDTALEAREGLELNSIESSKDSLIYLGGELQGLDRPKIPWYSSQRLDPAETRALFAERAFSKVAGFCARKPMSRAHEHWTKTALEICEGLLIHSMVGTPAQEALEEFPAEARFRACEALVERYYPRGRVVLGLYPGAFGKESPRQSLLEAIVFKNHGCSHFIVDSEGRGANSQSLFQHFSPAELGIESFDFEPAFYSRAVDAMGSEKTAPGDESTRIYGDAASLSKALKMAKKVPGEAYRPCVVEALLEALAPKSS